MEEIRKNLIFEHASFEFRLKTLRLVAALEVQRSVKRARRENQLHSIESEKRKFIAKTKKTKYKSNQVELLLKRGITRKKETNTRRN